MDFNKNKIDFVIYHAGCCDGFGSAYGIWKYFQKNNKSQLDNIIFYPAKHGSSPPSVTNKNVVICDFSYNKCTLENMIKKSNSLIILDHHKSAEKELKDIPDNYKIFDMNHSGAVITWKYFFPDTEIPKFIKYIEDRDIWKKEMDYTDEFSLVFQTIPMKFEEYDKYLDNNNLEKLIKKGKVILEYNNNSIKQICKYAVVKFSEIKDKYYMIAYVQSNVLKSDIGNYLVTHLFPNCDFSVTYNYDDLNNVTKFSLRSDDNKEDVSVISKLLGGGGHRNASGVLINGILNSLPSNIIDSSSKTYNFLENMSGDLKKIKIKNETYSAIYLNFSINKSKIGKYLLQKKYESCHFAIIWHYNSQENKTLFTIVLNNKYNINKHEISNEFNGTLYDNIILCKKIGFNLI